MLLTAAEGLSPQLLRYVTVWQMPFEIDDVASAVAEIAAAAKARDGERTAELIRALYAPARETFIRDYRRTDDEIDARPRRLSALAQTSKSTAERSATTVRMYEATFLCSGCSW